MMSPAVKSAISSILGLIGLILLLFLSAGTLDYWQAWVFLGIFITTSLVPGIFLSRIDPAAMERRRHAGPKAESRPVQKAVITGTMASFAALLVVSGLDRRFGWSQVPVAISVIGDVLVVTGLGVAMLVVFQNRYAAATITVEEGQPLVSTGLYAIVRHPMYSASVVMMVGMALALASYCALLVVAIGIALLIVRILDEEKMLSEQLTGYSDYMHKVRYRLLPPAW
jgi:protein-S-isoprenylcysteine O-methyltransferase Ste14